MYVFIYVLEWELVINQDVWVVILVLKMLSSVKMWQSSCILLYAYAHKYLCVYHVGAHICTCTFIKDGHVYVCIYYTDANIHMLMMLVYVCMYV